MKQYKYRAVNQEGRSLRGTVSAVDEVDLYNQLQATGLELVQCKAVGKGGGLSLSLPQKIKIRDLIQLFINMEQMQNAGIPLLSALSDIRDTAASDALRDAMSEIHKDVTEGSSLSDAMAKHPKIFNALYVSLIAAGEETGNLTAFYAQLVKYMKWVDEMQTKVRKATKYPIMVLCVVVLTITVMMGVVVPQIVGFIANMDQEIPVYTAALMATSDFFRAYWWGILGTPVIMFIIFKLREKISSDFAFWADSMLLKLPMIGDLIRKINIARFCQTFGAMYTSGIDVLRALESARNTVDNRALDEALMGAQEQVSNGATLSFALSSSGEFPSMVVRMVKIGEESGGLAKVLDQVSDFYTKDVDEAVSGLISMIEPLLTAILGGMILWIAVAVFGPIYSSFENIDF